MASQILSIIAGKDCTYVLKMKAENSSETSINIFLTTHKSHHNANKLKFRNEIYKYLKISYSLNAVIYQYTRDRYLETEFLPHRKHSTSSITKAILLMALRKVITGFIKICISHVSCLKCIF